VAGQLVAAAAGVPGACSEDVEPSDRTTTSAICVNGDNVNNYVRMTLLKITFFGFPKVKWLHLTGEVDKSVRCSCQIFSGFNIPNITKIGNLKNVQPFYFF